jgi:glycolate oxidase iron-sulfur subunit
MKVGEAKVASILATRAEVVASGCPSCLSQLRTLLRAAGCPARVCHPVELFTERLLGA